MKIYKLDLEDFNSEFSSIPSKEFSDKIEDLYISNARGQESEVLFDDDQIDDVNKYLNLRLRISVIKKDIEDYSNHFNKVDARLMRLKKLGIWQAPLTPPQS